MVMAKKLTAIRAWMGILQHYMNETGRDPEKALSPPFVTKPPQQPLQHEMHPVTARTDDAAHDATAVGARPGVNRRQSTSSKPMEDIRLTPPSSFNVMRRHIPTHI